MISGCIPRYSLGGKGNVGKLVNRNPAVISAGLPSEQMTETAPACLQHYLLHDEVQALLGDTIFPPPVPRPRPPNAKPIQDYRHATGVDTQVAKLINPPNRDKFHTLVDEVKETAYKSYWKSRLGRVPDPTPMLPDGMDPNKVTFGIKTLPSNYNIIIPDIPVSDQAPKNKDPSVQTNRNYCHPSFNRDHTYGMRTFANDDQGLKAKCAMKDDRTMDGRSDKSVVSSIKGNFSEVHASILGLSSTPNKNLNSVPEGYAFGTMKKDTDGVASCVVDFHLNKDRMTVMECLHNLHASRRKWSQRSQIYRDLFFRNLYLKFKHIDTELSGWLPKRVVYETCRAEYIRVNPEYVDPLLKLWGILSGDCLDYEQFCRIINFRLPLPDLPKIHDVYPEYLDYRTTYGEMVKPEQESLDKVPRAGVPTGRYFDTDYPVTPEMCCAAVKTCLTDESDMYSCIYPSIMTLFNISHRDMFCRREPHLVRRVFEAAGEEFTDEEFNDLWEEAKQYHSEGWVSYETFRKVLKQRNMTNPKKQNLAQQ